MSKQVDVLAELDRRIEIGELFGQEHGAPNLPGVASLREARAAVAELIEASKFALDKSWEYGADEPHFVKLNVAIARCNGGAA